MKVACHYTIPEPPHLELDAAVQDGLKIIDKVGGEINFLYPGKKVKKWFPQFLCGFQQLEKLKKIDKRVDVHHVFSNGFYSFPIYNFLKKPIVVSTVISLQQDNSIRFPGFFRNVKQFIVPSDKDKQIMKGWGVDNVTVILPGIDLEQISISSCPIKSKFVLLSGSAPWTKQQFTTKGVDLLVEALRELPWLHVVFLWRGLLLDELKRKVKESNVGARVTILTEKVDVNHVLQGVHAGIVIAADDTIVKAYPHSLLETLASGKPVLVSDSLRLADYVAENNTGCLVKGFSLENLIYSLHQLRDQYKNYAKQAVKLDMVRFSNAHMVQSIIRAYNYSIK